MTIEEVENIVVEQEEQLSTYPGMEEFAYDREEQIRYFAYKKVSAVLVARFLGISFYLSEVEKDSGNICMVYDELEDLSDSMLSFVTAALAKYGWDYDYCDLPCSCSSEEDFKDEIKEALGDWYNVLYGAEKLAFSLKDSEAIESFYLVASNPRIGRLFHKAEQDERIQQDADFRSLLEKTECIFGEGSLYCYGLDYAKGSTWNQDMYYTYRLFFYIEPAWEARGHEINACSYLVLPEINVLLDTLEKRYEI